MVKSIFLYIIIILESDQNYDLPNDCNNLFPFEKKHYFASEYIFYNIILCFSNSLTLNKNNAVVSVFPLDCYCFITNVSADQKFTKTTNRK